MKPVTSPVRPRPPTARHVARRAGVSVATVSRVLNDSPLVTEATRARVHEAIAELGFRRSSTARSLSLGRSQTIGVVAPFFTTPSVVERLRGVVGALAQRGYDLLLFDIEAPDRRPDALLNFAQRGRVDGLLVISLPLTDHEVGVLLRDELPVVLVDVAHPQLAHLVIDDVHGGELAAAHLLAKGHRRIGFVGDLPGNRFGFTSSEHRRKGFHRALRQAGIEPEPELEQLGVHGLDESRALARALLRRDDPPTAVFAASDIQAIGVLQTAETLGLRVPHDVAVMGFDDIDMAAILGLTTVRQPLRETGAHGAERLLAAIEGEDHQPIEELESLAVIERRTT